MIDLKSLDYSLADCTKIFAIIDLISFSHEKGLREQGEHLVLTPFLMKIRNAVSDADKLDAMGRRGLLRMV